MSGNLSRAMVRERLKAAALTVARIRSEELDGDYYLGDCTLAYYEGRRDALAQLLEPEEPEAVASSGEAASPPTGDHQSRPC